MTTRFHRRSAAAKEQVFGPAFHAAARQSQVVRAAGLFGTFIVVIFLTIVRHLLTESEIGVATFTKYILIGLAFAVAYEGLILMLAIRAVRRQKSLPLWFWFVNSGIECLVPTGIALAIAHSGIIPPQHAMVAPGILAYALFIIVSTINLRPIISVVAGAVCALGHLFLIFFIMSYYNTPPNDPLPLGLMLSYPVFHFVLGIVAGGVSSRVRTHVLAAIRESEVRRKLETEFEAARQIQQGLMPRESPALEGFDIAGWNRPADQTGGDYYDWVALPDGRLAVMLADVTGHGLGPALVTAFCRAYARATMHHEPALQAAVTRINQLLSDDLQSQRFVTFVAVLLTPPSNTLEILSAGHGPLLHYAAATKAVTVMLPQGLPLGVMDDAEFEPPVLLDMKRGDVLVMPTDGFFEWLGPDGSQFGIERLKESIKSHAGNSKSAAQIIQGILADVERFAAGTPQGDDLTMVVVGKL